MSEFKINEPEVHYRGDFINEDNDNEEYDDGNGNVVERQLNNRDDNNEELDDEEEYKKFDPSKVS
jgi:hypothetical protein